MTELPINPDMAEIEAQVLAETVEDEGDAIGAEFVNLSEYPEMVMLETPEIGSVFTLAPPPESMDLSGRRSAIIKGRRAGNKAIQTQLLLAMLGGMPSGGFPEEPTVHDTLSANLHDHKGALDRAKAKRERKLQRNMRASK